MVKHTTETCTEKQVISIHVSKSSHVQKKRLLELFWIKKIFSVMPTNQMSIYKFVYRGLILFWVGKGETKAWEKMLKTFML